MKSFTDLFIRHPVLAVVVNLAIVLVGEIGPTLRRVADGDLASRAVGRVDQQRADDARVDEDVVRRGARHVLADAAAQDLEGDLEIRAPRHRGRLVVDPVLGVGVRGDRELIAYCRSKLAHYKCPVTVDFVDELPRLPTGKLLKRQLREQYWVSA